MRIVAAGPVKGLAVVKVVFSGKKKRPNLMRSWQVTHIALCICAPKRPQKGRNLEQVIGNTERTLGIFSNCEMQRQGDSDVECKKECGESA